MHTATRVASLSFLRHWGVRCLDQLAFYVSSRCIFGRHQAYRCQHGRYTIDRGQVERDCVYLQTPPRMGRRLALEMKTLSLYTIMNEAILFEANRLTL